MTIYVNGVLKARDSCRVRHNCQNMIIQAIKLPELKSPAIYFNCLKHCGLYIFMAIILTVVM